MGDLSRRLSDRRIDLQTTEAAQHFIARQGYDPVFGARPLKRFILHHLETLIGRALIAGDIADGDTITVDLENGELQVRHQAPEDEGVAHRAA